jgi:hypothetical protein
LLCELALINDITRIKDLLTKKENFYLFLASKLAALCQPVIIYLAHRTNRDLVEEWKFFSSQIKEICCRILLLLLSQRERNGGKMRVARCLKIISSSFGFATFYSCTLTPA